MPCDIGHLCFLPTDGPGSVNRTVGRQIRALEEFRHVCISFERNVGRDSWKGSFYVVGGGQFGIHRSMLRLLPESFRRRLFGFGEIDHALWLFRAREVLKEARPAVIVSHDHYKLGRWLRSWVDWPCRLVFKQHGYAYFNAVPDPYELASFDAVVFLTRASYEYNRLHRHSFESSVEIIPNPIDGARFRPASAEERIAARDEFGLPPEAVVVTTVARQVPKKGAHILIECWRQVVERYPRAILWVVGPVTPATYEARLRESARLSGLECKVRFQGAIAPEMAPRVLGASDVFIFPSLCHEGMPLALLQGMSCGLPCISSRWPELEEVMTGLPVEWVEVPNDPLHWAEAVMRTIESLPRGERLARAQWDLVQERYGEERTLDRWRRFYRNQIELVRGAG